MDANGSFCSVHAELTPDVFSGERGERGAKGEKETKATKGGELSSPHPS